VNVTAFVQSAFASDEKMSNFQKEFLIEKEAKIRFLAWPGSSEFELTFQQADELGYLHDDPKNESIKDADLLLFFLDGWDDLEKIPQNYEDFTRIFDSIDRDGGEVTLHYDVDFGEESGLKSKRLYFLNIRNIPEQAFDTLSDACRAKFIYGSAFPEDAFKLWMDSGCLNTSN
jgi:hypothetical protein